MKRQKTNNQNKIGFEVYKPNFSFSWVFSQSGLIFQSHNEDEYRKFLDLNYIAKSNQDL
jgi:hypothetical protein